MKAKVNWRMGVWETICSYFFFVASSSYDHSGSASLIVAAFELVVLSAEVARLEKRYYHSVFESAKQGIY